MADQNGTPELVRAAIYARVSTADQEKKETIKPQVAALREFALRWDMEITDEYLDDGISGTLALDKRPEGFRMMQDAADGKFSVILFYKSDRMARNLSYLLDTIKYFDSVNVSMNNLTEPFDTSTPMGTMVLQILGSFAQMERSMILERTTAGRNRKAQEGIWSGGIVPYGFKLDAEGKLIPNCTPRKGYDFSETDIIQRIFQWVGNEKGSAIGTAKRLNEEGIPMWRKYQSRKKAQIEPVYRSTKTGTWMSATVNAMIRAPIYKGVHIYNGDIEREVTALVDEDIWDRAQAQLASNRNLSERGNRKYLLRGFITCSDCGAAYWGMYRSHRYYRCSSQFSSNKASTGTSCDAKMIPADAVEQEVWDYLKIFAKNPGDVLEELRTNMALELADVPKIEDRRKELDRLIRLKKGESDRMLDAYKHEVVDLATLKEHMDRSNAEIEPLQTEYMNLMTDQTDRATTVAQIASVEELLLTLNEGMDMELDWEGQREMIEGYLRGVLVSTRGTKRRKIASYTMSWTFETVGAVDSPTPNGSCLPG